jgi:hypothetical protein
LASLGTSSGVLMFLASFETNDGARLESNLDVHA